LMFI